MTAKRRQKNVVTPFGDRSLTLREAALKRGRKRICESRATEIRTKLVEWKQIPEPVRISLRALAAEIGVSHQLLSFFLQRLDEWQWNEQRKEYQRQAKVIHDRADAENRLMSESEMERFEACQRAACQCIFGEMADKMFRGFEADARRGQLHPKIADYLARRVNDPRAQQVLRLAKMPKKRNRLDTVLDEFERMTDSDKAPRLLRKLTPEERKEFWVLQQKRSRARQADRP